MKKIASILLTAYLFFACAQANAQSSQLDLQQNGMLVTTDGEDAFFFLPTAEEGWAIQTASRHFLGQPPLHILPPEQAPCAMLYADANSLWYACYSPTLGYEDEGSLWSAAVLYRLDRHSDTSEAVVTDADAQGLYPGEGSSLYYTPWNNAGMLCSLDFLTGHSQPLATLDQELIWSVTRSANGLFVCTLDAAGEEGLYLIAGGKAEALPLPPQQNADCWLQGDYCIAHAEDPASLRALPLTAPADAALLPEAMESGALYQYGNVLLNVLETEDGLANVYYVNLEEQGTVKHLYYDATPYYFVLGYGGQALTVLDGMGRVLRVADDFGSLEQIAQVDLASLYDEGVWLYALPFDDYTLLLGYEYEDSFHHPGNRQPPTLVKVIPTGTGMHEDAEEDAVG